MDLLDLFGQEAVGTDDGTARALVHRLVYFVQDLLLELGLADQVAVGTPHAVGTQTYIITRKKDTRAAFALV